MEIVYDEPMLCDYMAAAVGVTPDRPILSSLVIVRLYNILIRVCDGLAANPLPGSLGYLIGKSEPNGRTKAQDNALNECVLCRIVDRDEVAAECARLCLG